MKKSDPQNALYSTIAIPVGIDVPAKNRGSSESGTFYTSSLATYGSVMRILLLLLLLTVVLFQPCIAADKSGKYTILSMGTKSCGEVVSDFKEDGRAKLSNSIWVAGYLTAINERVVSRSNVAAGTDPAAWDLWIYNYCSANPLESLASAATALVGELSKRRP